MFTSILYLLILILLLIFLILVTVYTALLIYSSVMGSPYVPSKQKEAEFILGQVKLERNKLFIDLGCGDGRIVRTAVRKYGVCGMGVDVNPLLIFIGRIFNKLSGISDNATLDIGNIFNVDLKGAEYIYLFLMPELITKLKIKLEKEMKKNSVVISHGFPVTGWEKKLFKKIQHVPFPTYFYRI